MRQLQQLINSQPASDGDGVKIRRLAGQQVQQLLNPFLMIDEIRSDAAADYIGGFPEHPHRGFETITYMKAGRLRHRDHMGHTGLIRAGDVQWMTAGRGVLHSEMPEQQEGLLHGFQLWLNLPRAEKMRPAAYREIPAAEITERALPGGGLLRLVAGTLRVGAETLSGPMPGITTEPVLMDVRLPARERLELAFAEAYPAAVYVYQGAMGALRQGQLGSYSAGSLLALQAGDEETAMLVLSGRPIDEPIVQYGPFVMNSELEIEQALRDYRDGRLTGEAAL